MVNRTNILAATLMCCFAAGFLAPESSAGKTPARAQAPARPKLEGWATSRDELIKQFLDALSKKDEAALEKLRVTQDEYVRIILPGSVAPGQSLRKWPDDVTGYFFRDLNTKSLYSQQHLLQAFGGHRYTVEAVEYDKGVKRYANHVAYRQLRLKLKDESGDEEVLATGSIAEIDRKYKFISFLAD